MKVIFWAILALVLGYPADTSAAEELTAGDAEACKMVSQIAEKIMTARQVGVPMANAMDVMIDSPGVLGNAGKVLVEMAYEVPRFQTEEFQHREVVEFGNQAYSMCLRAKSK